MERSVRYGQIMTNFDSAYNTEANHHHHPPIYMPISSSTSFSSQSTQSNPKFNLDLYNPNEYHSDSYDYPSPSSSVIIHHHHPVHSPPPSQAISKLRQINDELCYTLAQCDLNIQSQPVLPHYHVHHYPISRETSPSPPRREQSSSSSTDPEPVPKKRNARITYKVHIPRRQDPLPQVDRLLLSTSDVYSRDDPMTVDLYPTRDQGFVRQIRNRPDNQTPWLADTSPIRRNSFSEGSTYRTPRAPYYDDAPIQPNSRLAIGKVRPRSSSVKSRTRPDTAPNSLRQSVPYFSSSAPVWRPNGPIKRPKFIGSNAPPTKPKLSREPAWNPGGTIVPKKATRAFDPSSKSVPRRMQEPTWHPPSQNLSKKPPKYFEPEVKPELVIPIQKQTDFLVRKKSTIPKGDPNLKARINNAESKVNSIRTEPITTVIRPKPPVVPPPKRKPPTPVVPKTTRVKPTPSPPTAPVKKIVPPSSAKTDTGRSSLNDVPVKPIFQSTPRNQSIDEDPDDLFDEETQISEPQKEPVTPPRIEKTPAKSPASIAPEPNQGTKATIKNGALIHGDDTTHRTPSPSFDVGNNNNGEELASPTPPPQRKAPSPKPDRPAEVSIIDDEDINQSEENATDEDEDVKNTSDTAAPSTPKADQQTPPRRTQPSPLPQSPPPPRTTEADNAVDDFFD